MKRFAIAAFAVFLASAAGAQTKPMDMDHKGMEMKMEKKDANPADAHAHHASGVVKSVNTDNGTVSIQHGPVPALNWPAMTMSFKAKDKKSLQALKPGQKIDFEFVQQGKDYVVTKVK